MRKFILPLLASTAALGLMASAVQAADLPVRAAPPPIVAVPLFTWTGFYVGLNAGYGWQGSNDNSIFVPAGTFLTAPLASGLVTFPDNEGDGFVGGGQIGYNYQIGSFVVGLEGDIQYADFGREFSYLGNDFESSDWFGTVRARAGVAFGQALIYGTGGFAFADDVGGWTVGGGVEYAFTNNLSLKVEGLYVNLDNNNRNAGVYAYDTNNVLYRQPGFSNRNSGTEFAVVRAGLNYKFGSY